MKPIALFLTLTFMSLPAFAKNDCQKARQRYYQDQASWDNRCGNKPDDHYLQALKSDCAATVRRIETRNKVAGNFASWNSEWGWAAVESCESLQRGDEL